MHRFSWMNRGEFTTVEELRSKQINQPFNLPAPTHPYSLETLQKNHANAIDYSINNFQFFDSLFELTGRFLNFKGYFFLLLSATQGQTPPEIADFSYHYFIKDVFETADKGFVWNGD